MLNDKGKLDPKTILVPTDFSASAQHALETASELARQFGSKLILLHAYHVDIPMQSPVMPGGPALPPGFYDQMRDHAKDRVEQAAEPIRASGVDVTTVAVGEPASFAIVSAAERHAADLIVMGTRGYTGVKHALLGSVAERVLRLAPCPVLSMKVEEDE